MEKTDLRIIKTKNTLYSTLENLMKKQSFEEIKVSDICNKALINRSTFYSHYNDKYELLSEYINNLKNNLESELNKNNNITNSKEYYLELIRLLLDHIEEKKDTYNAIMITNRNSITMDIVYDVVNREIIKQMNYTNEKTKVPSSIISKFYLGGVINVCIDWLQQNNKYTKEEIINYIDSLIPNDLNK